MTKDSKQFTAVSDGFGGLIIPDEAVEQLQKDRGFTPSDQNWKQTPDMLVLEACAGTVIKVTKTKTIVRVSKNGRNELSKDGTITIDDNNAEVGDRVMHFSNQDGSSWSITCRSDEGNASLSEYEDGESIVVALTPAKGKKGTGKLDVVPTVEKRVVYPRMATLDGVQYPWIIARDTEKAHVFVRTKKGWTLGGQLAVAQHAENVAVARANEGGTAPTKLPKNATTVLIRVKNLAEVVEKYTAAAAREDAKFTVDVDEELIPVTNLNTKRRGIFGGIVISKSHDPKLAHGWYTRKPSAADAPAYDWLLRALYGAALEKFNLAPVAQEEAAA